jgi:hypothetical protein
MQPHLDLRYLSKVWAGLLIWAPGLCLPDFIWYKRVVLRIAPRMSSAGNHEQPVLRIWWAVVAFTVCSLAVSLATRYTSPVAGPSSTVRAIQTHIPADAKKQRMAKDAGDWVPPVCRVDTFCRPSVYAVTAPLETPAPPLFSRLSLYNRPPPSSLIS